MVRKIDQEQLETPMGGTCEPGDVISIPEVTVEGTPSSDTGDPPIEFDPIGQALAGGLLTGPSAVMEHGAAGLLHVGITEAGAAAVDAVTEDNPEPPDPVDDSPGPEPADAGPASGLSGGDVGSGDSGQGHEVFVMDTADE
jgi:hypothetical protein